jgi:hypothetical protein
MPSGIIGSFDELRRFMPARWAEDYMDRESAMKYYLTTGGVTKVGSMTDKGWPALLYPGHSRIQDLMDDNNYKLRLVDERIRSLEKEEKKTKRNRAKELVMKAVDPLYLEHKLKYMTDENYRKVCKRVGPPMHLHTHRIWRRRLHIFVKDEEYRKRLLEARNSELGKHRGTMSDELLKNAKFRRELIKKNKEALEKEKENLLMRQKALLTLMEWSIETGNNGSS